MRKNRLVHESEKNYTSKNKYNHGALREIVLKTKNLGVKRAKGEGERERDSERVRKSDKEKEKAREREGEVER